MYIPPLMEALVLAELTHDAKGNKIKAKERSLTSFHER
jgi:hypothetical protein